MSEHSDFNARYARYRQAAAAATAHNKDLVFDALAAARLTSVTVTFDGYGDSGQIENIDWRPFAPSPDSTLTLRSGDYDGNITEGARPVTLAEAIEELCYSYLDQDNDGWENNDGAFGELVFDVAARTVNLTCNHRFAGYETSQHSY